MSRCCGCACVCRCVIGRTRLGLLSSASGDRLPEARLSSCSYCFRCRAGGARATTRPRSTAALCRSTASAAAGSSAEATARDRYACSVGFVQPSLLRCPPCLVASLLCCYLAACLPESIKFPRQPETRCVAMPLHTLPPTPAQSLCLMSLCSCARCASRTTAPAQPQGSAQSAPRRRSAVLSCLCFLACQLGFVSLPCAAAAVSLALACCS